MIHLVFHELKGLFKHPVPWILLIIMILGARLSWQSLSEAASRKMKYEMDPIARYQLTLVAESELQEEEEAFLRIEEALKQPDLSEEERLLLEEKQMSLRALLTGGFLEGWYQKSYPILPAEGSTFLLRTAPDYEEEFNRVKELMTLARDENLKARAFPYLDHGLDFSAYTLRLFHFSQSGVLLLSALILSVMSPRMMAGPLYRKAGSWPILLSRITALMILGVIILILPRVVASFLMGVTHGFGSLELVIPFNPRAGVPLFLDRGMEEAMLIRSHFSSIRVDSLIRLGPAFVLMYVYEIAQLFLWLSLGLLFSTLSSRYFFSLGIPLALMLPGRVLAPFLTGQFAGLFFPVYQDAVRDVLGGSNMLTGTMLTETPPLDYTTGLLVMVISGLAALYFAGLTSKGLTSDELVERSSQ